MTIPNGIPSIERGQVFVMGPLYLLHSVDPASEDIQGQYLQGNDQDNDRNEPECHYPADSWYSWTMRRISDICAGVFSVLSRVIC